MSSKQHPQKPTPEHPVNEKKLATKTEHMPESTVSSVTDHDDNVILICTDLSGRISRINTFGKSFLGKKENEIVGRQFAEILLPAFSNYDRRKQRLVNHFIYNTAQKDIGEFDTCHVSGNPRRVAWTKSRMNTSENGAGEMLYIGMDVNKFRAQESELSMPVASSSLLEVSKWNLCDSNANCGLLEAYIDSAGVLAWEIGEDGKIRYVSPGVEKVLGYLPEELIGQKMMFISTKEEEKRFQKALNAAVKTSKKHFLFKGCVNSKNGRDVWVEISGIVFCDKSNAFSGARCLSKDITPGVMLKEELLLRQQEHRYLFDNTQVALMVTGEDGTILNINQTFANIHERSTEEMIGRKFMEFLPESERETEFKKFTSAFKLLKSNKDSFFYFTSHLIKIETTRGIRYLKLVPVSVKVYENNRMVGILNTVMDVTESQKLQEELKKHQRYLHQLVDDRNRKIRSIQEELLRNERLTALGKMIATVGHEIRNPLSTISSSLYVVNERVKQKDFGIEPAIARSFRAIQRCDSIIEELLDFTRTKHLEKEMMDITPGLEKLLDEMMFPDNISVIRKIESELKVSVDPKRFFRCLSNILENAVEALNRDKKEEIVVSARLSGKFLEICVEDTGCGIEKKNLKAIYEPLYGTKQTGIGLGLPICKQIVDMHEGTMAIQSDVGKGTSVIIRMPVDH